MLVALTHTATHIAPAASREEILEFMASVSLTTLFSRMATIYWPTLLALGVCLILVRRFESASWAALPLLVLNAQQVIGLLDVFNGYPHHAWLLREFLVACIALTTVCVPLAAVLAFRRSTKWSRHAKLSMGATVLASVTVLLDWAFLLFFVSPLGVIDAA